MFKRSAQTSKDLVPYADLSPSERIAQVQADLEIERMRRTFETELQREAFERRQARTVEQETEDAKRRERRRHALILAVPITIINALAMTGQFGSLNKHLFVTFGSGWTIVVSAFSAVAIESIGLLLGYYAMRALKRGDSAFGLLFASTFVASLVALMNYDNYAVDLSHPTAASFMFALFSLTSPWLWRIHIRDQHRRRLIKRGEIDQRAAKLSGSRKFWHPVKSLKVVSHASWTGERNPARAVESWEREQEFKTVRTATAPQTAKTRELVPASPNGTNIYPTDNPKFREMLTFYRESLAMGARLTSEQLAAEFGTKNRVMSGKVIKYVREGN